MLALSLGGLGFSDQISGMVIASIAMATTTGAFFAGRVSWRKGIVDNLKTESSGWQRLYEQAKEQIEKNEERISALIAEGHDKDKQIANLTGKIDVILDFMQRALGPGFKSIIETTTTQTKTTSG
jgi:hypothetical protein